jgi:glycerol uptake facilitator-like aquaporin
MNNELMRASIAELLGTFTLVFVGVAAVASGQGVVVAALAHGLVLCGIIFAYGYISGAHVNPAVTAGLLVGRQITIERAVYYWIAQLIGGVVAAVLANILIPNGATDGQTIGSLTANSVWTAALFEAVLTFLLVSAVYQAAVFGKLGPLAALAIGLTLAGSILAGGTYTGASLNPMRTLGPAIVAGNFSYVVPYLIGIFGGGIIAGLLHVAIFRPKETVSAT